MLRRLRQALGMQIQPEGIEVKEVGFGQVKIKGDGIEIDVALPAVDFTDIEPPPLKPIVLDNPACPYCGVIQAPPPSRRRKCRDCKETILTWTNQEERVKYLLTGKDYEARKRAERDNRWAYLNQQILDASKKNDWHAVKVAKYEQSLMMFDRGGDHFRALEDSRRAELQYYRREYSHLGVKRVVIQAEGGCPECQVLHGKEYSIEEALELLPIPVRTCQTWAGKNGHGGFCRCYFDAVF